MDEFSIFQLGTEIDWDESPVNYTCYTPKESFGIEYHEPIESCVNVTEPALHKCMSDAIIYDDPIPTYGTHRPLWAVFGEYLFVPPQRLVLLMSFNFVLLVAVCITNYRWIHNLEHGAVVMLYHPCTHPQQVSRLRSLVTNCIRKHVITSYTRLTRERPLALLTWGCKMLMSYIDDRSVIQFIRRTAMKSPEAHVSADGQYEKYLIAKAEPIFGSNLKDSVLCPLDPRK